MQVVDEAHNQAPRSDPLRSRILSAAGLTMASCGRSRPSWSTSTIAG